MRPGGWEPQVKVYWVDNFCLFIFSAVSYVMNKGIIQKAIRAQAEPLDFERHELIGLEVMCVLQVSDPNPEFNISL